MTDEMLCGDVAVSNERFPLPLLFINEGLCQTFCKMA